MGIRKNIEQTVQLFLRLEGKKLIYLSHVFSIFRIALIYIKHKCFQKVHFRRIPEMIALAAACVFDDHINEKLRHQFLTFHFRKTAPGIGIFR